MLVAVAWFGFSLSLALSVVEAIERGPIGPARAALLLAFVAAATYGALRAWTTRVWVERAPSGLGLLLVHTRLGRRHAAVLAAPNTLEVRAPMPTGPRPQWRITLSTPEGERVRLAAPWVTDLPALLAMLGPIVEQNPTLPADEEARRFLLRR